MLNMRPMCVWLMLHPNASPPQAENKATRTVTQIKLIGERKSNSTPGRSSSHAIGITTSPATKACRVPKITFSMASHDISIGARRRSSRATGCRRLRLDTEIVALGGREDMQIAALRRPDGDRPVGPTQ